MINTSLLIAAPMLQDYFVDNVTAQAMSDGVITCYQDDNRTTFKNWYYQTGSPGNYTYIPLDNPLTLTAQGTIADANGNDTIPFFYPYSETDNLTLQPYYITVVDSNGQQQFTRQNFPFVSKAPVNTEVATLENYIINNNFWRNIGSLNAANVLNQVVAPSQHDSFNNPDIRYIKNVTGATETITFSKFLLGDDPLIGDITPEFYIDHNCTALQAGETQKVYQIPISLHVKTLENVPFTVTVQAQNVSGNNTMSLYIYQYLGTGVTSPQPFLIDTLTLNNSWKKYIIPFTFPTAAGAALSATGDDALYLQIGMPLSAIFNTNFTLPSIYLSTTVPTNSFATYDQVDSIISSPRTGDVRYSMNTFNPFGWVRADGTIGGTGSNATYHGADGWPLFNLFWQQYNNTQYNGASYLSILDSGGSSSTWGASAAADWNANKQISFPLSIGQAPMGASTVSTPSQITSINTGTFTITVASAAGYFNGVPVMFTNTGGALPTGITANTIYYATAVSGNTFQICSSYANFLTGVVVGISSSGTGTNTAFANIAGTVTGQYQHVQLTTELASHTHSSSLGGFIGPTGGVAGGSGTTWNSVPTTTATGSSAPFNVTQPSTFYNVFFKL
jgi:hypothetical protein